MKLSKWEKETIINFNEEKLMASIYTCSKSIIKRCEKLGLKLVDNIIDGDQIISKTFEIPKKLIKITKPRILTEEKKKELRNRLKKSKIR
jgi:hypothetical protein